MTPYKDRHLRNEYSMGTIATVLDEPTVDEPVAEPEPEEEQPEEEQPVEEPAGFVCEQCGETFDTQHGLAIHIGRMHSEEDDGA